MNERHRELHALLASLGHSSRFRIALRLLQGESSVGELARSVGLSQSCTTRHVQALERAGVVRSRRDGKRVLVGLERGRDGLAGLLEWIGPVEAPGRTRPNTWSGESAAAPRAGRTVRPHDSGGGRKRPSTAAGAEADPVSSHSQEQPPAQAPHSGKDAVPEVAPGSPRRRALETLEDFLL